jgi:histidinol-phosphate aminotransferase
MNTISISRREFTRLLGIGAAATTLKPSVSFGRKIFSSPAGAPSSGVVRLSANENPYGPSARAREAMNEAFSLAWRYPDEQNQLLINSLAKLNGVDHDQILLGDGSSEILEICAATFTDKSRKLVAADPTFEAILNYSRAGGAEVVKVPLTTPGYAHDLSRMGAAANKGLIYICNPNNPTASITPKDELRSFIAETPSDTTILVDEAYFHFADSPDYESVIPLVKERPNLIVARTFSKIYGMAGLRCGYCIAQKETIERMRPHQMWDSVNCMALAAASVSAGDADQVRNGRRRNSETREFTATQLEQTGYKSIPSQANFIMVDVKRPAVPLIQSLKERNVQVGRLFPALPNHMRVTIGKKSEMEMFLGAFREVIV